jgi:adenylate kinase
MIILACGLSGSGKTTIIAKAARACDFGLNPIKASDILREEGRPVVGLKASEAISNQKVIVDWLLRFQTASPGPILLDGHLLIETDDGPQLVPDMILAPLPLCGIIVIRSEPEVVAKRRKDTLLIRSSSEIRDLMFIEMVDARRLARARAVPFAAVRGDDFAGFTAAIKRALKNE